MKLATLVFSLFSLFLTSQLHAKDVVVLVPGFFSTFAPEYFSRDIVKTFQNKGFTVYIVRGLNPIGTIEENGVKLERYLTAVEKAEGSPVSFNLVAHSAGGFYSLFVANRQKFDIKNILTVGTPYKGVEVIHYWLENSSLFNLLTDLAHLDGLRQLTTEGVEKFISSIRISPKTRMAAFGGYQRAALDVWNARNLSTPFVVTSRYYTEDTDGLVGYSSALGLGSIQTTDGSKARQVTHPQYFVALEHWEQVLDSDSFLLLGVLNTGYIRKEQIRFYNGVANYLLTLQ